MSLRWKIWLSVFASLTALFGVTGWTLQRHAIDSATRSVEEEVRVSFRAYESVWQARQDMLGTAALLLSSLPNVRAAFGTQDRATIRDSAAELRGILSDPLLQESFFIVTDPRGVPIATITGQPPQFPTWPVTSAVSPGTRQNSGFYVRNGALYQLVVTPVHVDSAGGPALISILVAGYPVTDRLAGRLAAATGSSNFVFSSDSQVFASTQSPPTADTVQLNRPLLGLDSRPVGTLRIYRTIGAALQRLDALRRDLILMWGLAMILSLVLGFFLARRIVEPITALDRAASAIAQQNYDTRVPVTTNDELGRLAATFNSMSNSLLSARRELIRQERISTVGRLASSIVHDLRNPLAAIYSGAEMLVDSDNLPPEHTKRLATNIYNASRRVLEMLQELLDTSRGKTGERELCTLTDIIQAAIEYQHSLGAHIRICVDVPDSLEILMDRTRMERVFVNLIANAVEVMPNGGAITIRSEESAGNVLVHVKDEGPGIASEIRDQLFQPFTTFGKHSGMGLGLALSRQTVLEHGGDLTVENYPGGAQFTVLLPSTP